MFVNFNPNHQISTRQTLQNIRNRLKQRVRLCFDGPVTDESLSMKVTTKAAALGTCQTRGTTARDRGIRW